MGKTVQTRTVTTVVTTKTPRQLPIRQAATFVGAVALVALGRASTKKK